DPYVTRPYFSQNLNRLSYVYNSPLSWIDPNGFDGDRRRNYCFIFDCSDWPDDYDHNNRYADELDREEWARDCAAGLPVAGCPFTGDDPGDTEDDMPDDLGRPTDGGRRYVEFDQITWTNLDPTIAGGVLITGQSSFGIGTRILFYTPYVLAGADMSAFGDNIFANGERLPSWFHTMVNSPLIGSYQSAAGIVEIVGAREAYGAVRTIGNRVPVLLVGWGSYSVVSGLNKVCDSCISTPVVDALFFIQDTVDAAQQATTNAIEAISSSQPQ
ncbi:MAG TPA: hypothetical protein VKP88_01950, partial [Candidatus Paceibacterota bacterium]|nr:hypothetical protein [Candidatus Paceibacterota bacterium]